MKYCMGCAENIMTHRTAAWVYAKKAERSFPISVQGKKKAFSVMAS